MLKGADLPPIAGVAPGDVVAFIRHDGAWRQVPVQVDEMHEANMAVVHNRPPEENSTHLVYSDPGTLTGADPVPAIDRNDEIVFMARDAGAKASEGTADPTGVIADSGVEVAVSDPVAGNAQGFVYLFRKGPGSTLDPAAGHDYVRYDFALLAGSYPEDYEFEQQYNPVGDPPRNPAPNLNPESSTVTTPRYSTHFSGRWINDDLRIKAEGASNVDILDRDKHWFTTGPDNPGPGAPASCGRTENTFAASHGAFVSNIDGPVRAIRSFLGANSATYTEKRHIFYESRQDVTVYLRGHPGPEGPDSIQDYDGGAIGMTYRNDLNRTGVRIDGVPDVVRLGVLRWEQVSGPQGTSTSVHRVVVTEPGVVQTSFYADDATPDFVQCTGDGRALATSGPALVGPFGNTDPRREDEFGELYEITSYRTQYYDGPGQDASDAQQRDAWVRTPLVTRSAAWTG